MAKEKEKDQKRGNGGQGLVKREENSAIVPFDYLKPEGGAPRGGEQLGPRDVVQPRLAICQSMTPHRKESSDKHISGLQEGEYFNTAYGKRYGKSVLVVPVFFFVTNIRFKDYEDGGGILCQAQDGKKGVGDPGGDCMRCSMGPILGWTEDAKGKRRPPECTEMKNYAIIIIPKNGLPTREDAAILSFKSTAVKKSNEWASRLKSYGRDWWTTIHELTTTEVSNDRDQSWFVPVVNVYDGPRIPACGVPEGFKFPKGYEHLEPFRRALVSQEIARMGKESWEGLVAMHRAGRLVIDIDPNEGAEHDSTTEFPGGREPGDEG